MPVMAIFADWMVMVVSVEVDAAPDVCLTGWESIPARPLLRMAGPCCFAIPCTEVLCDEVQ